MRIGNHKIRMFKSFSFLIFFLTLLSAARAQNSMTLQECIEYAFNNSLSLKQAVNGIEMARLSDKQYKQARYPNISGSSFGALQLGRTIDPTTNSFDTRDIYSQSFGLDFSLALYSGNRINNNIKKGNLGIQAAEADADFIFNNLALNIANTYLQILMGQEQFENARKRKALSVQQLDYTDKLIQAGTLPANDRLDVLAQIARDEQTIVSAQNMIDINYLALKELMQLDATRDIKVVAPVVVIPSDANPDAYTFDETYVSALGTQPQIRREELALQSALLDVEIAQAAMMPSLFMFAGLDTRWSSLSKSISNYSTKRQTQTFYIDNTAVNVGFDVEVPTLINKPYFDQLEENFGQSMGVNLSVPIYNNGLNKINKERAKIGVIAAEVQNDLTKQQLKSEIQQALANARAARRSLEAAQIATQAARESFTNAEKRFQLGSINSLQLTIARNTLDIAETETIVAKYDYLFRLKIIDFYLGKPLKLD